MSNSEKPELSPEAINMLNEMAAKPTDEPELTPEAKANLAKLGNFHLTHTYRDYKNSYAVIAIVFCGAVVIGLAFVLNFVLRRPEKIAEVVYASPIIVGFFAIVLFFAHRMWNNYKRL